MKKALLILMVLAFLVPASAYAYFDSGFCDQRTDHYACSPCTGPECASCAPCTCNCNNLAQPNNPCSTTGQPCNTCNTCANNNPCSPCRYINYPIRPSVCPAGYRFNGCAGYNCNGFNTNRDTVANACPCQVASCNSCNTCNTNTCNTCNTNNTCNTCAPYTAPASTNTCVPCQPPCAPLCKGVIEGRAIPCGCYVDVVYADCGKDKVMRINWNTTTVMTPTGYQLLNGDVIRVEYTKANGGLMATSITRKEVGSCQMNGTFKP